MTAATDLVDERFDVAKLSGEANRTWSRRELREVRRQDRVARAEGPKARLDASWDYVRGVLHELEKSDPAAADRVRREAAAQLMVLGARTARR